MNIQKRTNIAIVLLIGALLAAVACGSDSSDSDSVKVSPASRNYSQQDFQAIGFKVVKDYDVEELPGATGASYGFWRAKGQDPRDYELRFYGSHDDAVRQGTSLAEEVTGSDAVLFTKEMTWKEGAKDRRHQVATSIQSGGELVPTYMDYAIYGNVVLLCEGLDSAQSLESCAELTKAIDGAVNG